MYAKIYMEAGGIKVPFFIVSRPGDTAMLTLLRSLGWEGWPGEYAEPLGELNISPESLSLGSGGKTILQDTVNPVSPPGWLPQVDIIGGCLVIVTDANLNFQGQEMVDQLEALKGSPNAVSAHANVTHNF